MRPLDGIRVVDFSTYVAVPTAARIMADWGAEVIKIEAPSGDLLRGFAKDQGVPCADEENPIFCVNNSGKKMLGIDLKTDEGMQILMELLENADVFCTNVRLRAIERLGLDYESLHKRFPKLIYLHFNGFGYEGPEAARPGFDATAFWGMTGIAVDWPNQGSTPLRHSPAFGDMVCAFSILSTMLGGIIHRNRTGEGIRLTTSLYANGLWCDYTQLIATQDCYKGISLPREYDSDRNPIGSCYQCKDGRWLLLQAGHPRQYKQCMIALEMEEYIDDTRFNNWDQLMIYHKELYHLITAQMKTKDAQYWADRLLEQDIVFMQMATTNEASKSDQAWANGYLTKIQFPNGNECVAPNSPATFYGCEKVETKHVGPVGCDTREILSGLGYSEEQISALAEKGVVVVK